ncbi:unnamed protein product [Porites lobata]|uniref:Uncharacterized protein n=1 Tax=Porites lobata TaxID=104759 RepID=A0ABN8MZQ3_9CNID|nr:unnamed protein product [Porites lobata]
MAAMTSRANQQPGSKKHPETFIPRGMEAIRTRFHVKEEIQEVTCRTGWLECLCFAGFLFVLALLIPFNFVTIPRDDLKQRRYTDTLKPENRVIIIYTSQNIKPLHYAVGSPMNRHYGGLVSNEMLVHGKVYDPPAV